MIGLCGSHRTGKTTLAKAFAEAAEIPFLQTRTTQVFAEMGLDPSADHPFDVRMAIQERILEVFRKDYAEQPKVFITDRTPIDMMAYTLADVRQNTLTPEQEIRLQKYLDDCIDLTNKTFSILVVLQPAIDVKYEPGKASLSPGYIAHHAAIIMGLVVGEEISASHFYIPKKMKGLQERVSAISFAIKRAREKHDSHLEMAKESGRPIVFH